MIGEWTDPRLLIDILWRVGTLVGLAWVAVRQRVAATQTEIEAVARDVADQDRRIIRIEERIEAMPTRADMARISERLEGVAVALAGVTASLASMERTVTLLHEHHIGER
ncbi:DUF2730 family protein (plasmid) [Tistrella mobilis]|uniref:DUF2730 family protein n=1 Tax=Tistrella mobilis TaxID=171437 RepID=UPI0035577F2A